MKKSQSILNRCKDTCNSVNKRLNSKEKDRISTASGLSKKYTVGAGRVHNKQKVDLSKKKTKYSNMKMLYQNAVYKSLNLNQSPSNSSRGGNSSRELSLKSRESNGSSKYSSGVARILDQNPSKIKFQVNNTQYANDRKARLRNSKREISREKSEGHSTKKLIGISKDKSSITQQFYSPSDSRKILKSKSKNEPSVDKNKNPGVRTHRSKVSDNFNPRLENSANKTNSSHLKAMISGSKSKVKVEKDNSINNDTFESTKEHILKTEVKDQRKSKYKLESYRTKNLSQLNNEIENEHLTNNADSARHSEQSSKYLKNPVKEFMEAAANGIRDKLDKLLKTGKIQDINVADHFMKTALHYAVGEGRYKTIGFLINHNIDPNLQTKTKKETALHIACKKGYKKIIVSLLNNNSNPNIQDSAGKTPLHVVAELNSKELIIAFINHCKYPIDWDLTDNYGRKVYEIPNSKEICRLLTTYMKTASAQRYSRETRLYNKLNNRTSTNLSSSRSKSRETGSLSKRTYKFKQAKSPDKSPL